MAWLAPYTEDEIRRLARAGVRRLILVPISFVSDHIETLWELDRLYAGLARDHGITRYHRARAFNDDPRFDLIEPRTLTSAYPWGGKYTMTVLRGASEQRIELTYSPRWNAGHIPAALTFWLIGIVFLAFGWVIGLVRPDQTVPRLASLTLLVSAVFFLTIKPCFPAFARATTLPPIRPIRKPTGLPSTPKSFCWTTLVRIE